MSLDIGITLAAAGTTLRMNPMKASADILPSDSYQDVFILIQDSR